MEDVINFLKILKDKVSEIKIGTHIIFGFLGEKETDFLENINLINTIPFDFLIVFEYSDNPLADSSKLIEKINGPIKKRMYNQILNRFYNNEVL